MDNSNSENVMLSDLGKEIPVFDRFHCCLYEISFTIIKSKNSIDEDSDIYDFSISGDNNENFNGNCSNSEIKLYSQDGNSVFYLKSNSSHSYPCIKRGNTRSSLASNSIMKKEIYSNENEKNPISTIRPIHRGAYRVEIINIAKNTPEHFEMISDGNLKSCDIYYGDRKKDALLICKIVRNGDDCEIKIASGVDYIFILGLASFYFCKHIYEDINYNNNYAFNDDNYDRVARMSMPPTNLINDKVVDEGKFDKDSYVTLSDAEKPKEEKEEKKGKEKKSFLQYISYMLRCGGTSNE